MLIPLWLSGVPEGLYGTLYDADAQGVDTFCSFEAIYYEGRRLGVPSFIPALCCIPGKAAARLLAILTKI